MADPVAHILVDTVATAVLFFAGKLMTELYLGYRSIASFYGGASSLVIFRMWVYDAAQILYVGADVTKAYAKHRGRKITPSEALDGT